MADVARIVFTSIAGIMMVVDGILLALSLIFVVRCRNAVKATGAKAVRSSATTPPGFGMAWIVAPMMIEESIFIRLICLIVIEGGHVVEAIGMAILLTVAIPRIVSGIVTTVVESILLGLIWFCIFASFIAIEEGVAVLVMERCVVIIMGKAWATRILVAIVAVTGLSPGNCIFFSSLIGLGIFSDSVLLLLLILGIVIEG